MDKSTLELRGSEKSIDLKTAIRYAQSVEMGGIQPQQLAMMIAVLASAIGVPLDRGQTLEDTFFEAMQRALQSRGLAASVISSHSKLWRMEAKRSGDATKAANRRWEIKIGKEKEKVRKLWERWRTGSLSVPGRKGSKSAFARYALSFCDETQDPRTITQNWMPEWDNNG